MKLNFHEITIYKMDCLSTANCHCAKQSCFTILLIIYYAIKKVHSVKNA